MEETHSTHNYIFYTPEGFCTAPNGMDVENLQVLGIANGTTDSDALHNLLVENEWVDQMGFNHDAILSRELL